MKKIQSIMIDGMDNGIFVKVGCLRLVYQEDDLHDFFIDLKAYFKNPSDAEKEIRKRWKIKENECIPQPTHPIVTPTANDESCDSAE